MELLSLDNSSIQLYISDEEFNDGMSKSSPFHEYCLSKGITKDHLSLWNVGADLKNRTIFFQVNKEKKCLNFRKAWYSANGKQKSLNFISKSQPKDALDRYFLGLFGEHLLSDSNDRSICLVLDERTAVVGSFIYPQYDWIAVAGTKLQDEHLEILRSRTVYSIRSNKKFSTAKVEKQLLKYQITYGIVDVFGEDTESDDTLADVLFSGRTPDLKQLSKDPKDLGVELNLPEGVDPEDVMRYGFYEHENQYWFQEGLGTFSAKSNFIVEPLFHIYSKSDNKRLIRITNVHGHRRIIDVPSKGLISLDLFNQIMYNEGNFMFFGTKVHLMKVLGKISNLFRLCNELTTLGWQREGFYAFSNGIFSEDEFIPVDEFGITEYEEKFYFSPAFSEVYKNVREDDDHYENDRFFVYKESPIKFHEWAIMMEKVYKEHGIISIAYFISSLFRDIIYSRYKVFPHLFLFGEKRTGKSQLAFSLNNIFLNKQPPFNLNSGTDVAFYRKNARFRNAIAVYEEYTNDIDAKRFQALKAAYDGTGREKGVMTGDNRTTATKINSACLIAGQYLPTRDDNSLFTRSILLTFKKREFHDQDIKNYSLLKEQEEKGLSSIICEVLRYRSIIEEKYTNEYEILFKEMRGEVKHGEYDERLLRNFCTIITPVKLLFDNLRFPFTFKELWALSKKMLVETSSQITSSEGLSTFWNMIVFLKDRGLIKEGIDFKIETLNQVSVIVNREENKIERFTEPTKLLFIKINQIHPLYMEHHRKQHGANGIDATSLKTYYSSKDSYIGSCKGTRFENGTTSAYVFDYEKLGVSLEGSRDQSERVTITGILHKDSFIRSIDGKEFLSFNIGQKTSYRNHLTMLVEGVDWYSCNLKDFTSDDVQKLVNGANIKVTGIQEIRRWTKDGNLKTSRTITIESYEILINQNESLPEEFPVEDLPF